MVLAAGSHACTYYEAPAERDAILSEFFASGVAQRRKLFYYCEPGMERRLCPDAAPLIDSGQLVVGDAMERYFPNGRFRSALEFSRLRELEASVFAEGYNGLGVFAESWCALEQLGDPTEWVDYELSVTKAMRGTSIIGICAFKATPAERRAGHLADLDVVHPVSLGPRGNGFWLDCTGEGVALCGEVDRFSARQVRDLLRRALAEEPVLDLAGLDFVDSAGVCAVYEAIDGMAHSSLRNVPPMFARIWAVVHA